MLWIGHKIMEKLKLVIVESPAKSRTISRFLGKDYRIVATMGHMRDLPADKFAVDIKNGFEPTYTIMAGKSKTVSALRKAADGCSSIFLATDEDREGEAIAWHTAHILKKDPAEMKRVAFHEITSEAVKNAFKKPRGIDIRLVNSQQARRILDRVVGYTLSPLLGQRIKKGLSAGRVQSAALRILVDREKEIKAFISEKYFVISAELARKENPDFPFTATLSGKDNKKFPKPGIKERDEAEKITAFLQVNPLLVSSIHQEEKKEYPLPPFTTSTLQQEAGRRLNLPATRTMSIAQELYEGVDLGPQGAEGLITYHRTDSLTIAVSAREEASRFIKETMGKQYLPDRPPVYRTKSNLAQEAHEAIRPTSALRTPKNVAAFLTPFQLKVYTLVWERFVASQMAAARVDLTKVKIECGPYFFDLEGQVLKFDGYRKVIGSAKKENALPPLVQGERIDGRKFEIEGKETQPPDRYSEAGLIKAMEKFGIGRPSTYAPTINTLLSRKYVNREKKILAPDPLGIFIIDFLVQQFPEVVNLEFTAQMEKKLDKVAEGKEDWRKVLSDFYKPFAKAMDQAEKSLVVSKEVCPKCEGKLLLKKGKYGAFWSCENYPKCRYSKNMLEKETFGEPKYTPGNKTDGAAGKSALEEIKIEEKCPKCGGNLTLRQSRFGKFLGCATYPKCKFTKQYKP